MNKKMKNNLAVAIPLTFVIGLTGFLVTPANAETALVSSVTSTSSEVSTPVVTVTPVETATPTTSPVDVVAPVTTVTPVEAPVTEVVTAPITDPVQTSATPSDAYTPAEVVTPAPVTEIGTAVSTETPTPVVDAPVTEIGTAVSTTAPEAPTSGIGDAVGLIAPVGEVAPGAEYGDCQMGNYKFAAHATTEDCGSIFAAYDDNVKNAALYAQIGSAISHHFDAEGKFITEYNGFVINSGSSDTTTWDTIATLDQVVRDLK